MLASGYKNSFANKEVIPVEFNEQINFLIPENRSQINGAIFVAHPDDETIWMGGTILSKSHWKWKIYIATHNYDDSRGIEFRKAITRYMTEPGIHGLEFQFIEAMEDSQYADPDKEKIYDKLNSITLEEYDIIFTHNIDGEYNHINHRILGEYFNEKRRKGLNVWHFLCPAIQRPRKKIVGKSIESMWLNQITLAKKASIFKNSYISQQFLWKACEPFMRFQFYSGLEMFTQY